jgi:hypothetical protein
MCTNWKHDVTSARTSGLRTHIIDSLSVRPLRSNKVGRCSKKDRKGGIIVERRFIISIDVRCRDTPGANLGDVEMEST